jgi:hypothetical protein
MTPARVQSGILLCACHPDIPDLLPGCIKWLVYWEHTRVVRCNSILVLYGYTIFLATENQSVMIYPRYFRNIKILAKK